MADWHWEPVTDDLLDGLSPAALAAVCQVAEELTVRESMIFFDGREFTGEPPGLRTVQQGPLMLAYLTDVRGERVVRSGSNSPQATQSLPELTHSPQAGQPAARPRAQAGEPASDGPIAALDLTRGLGRAWSGRLVQGPTSEHERQRRA